jgi:sortase A
VNYTIRLPLSALRVAAGVCVWLGVFAMAIAGGTIAYASIYQQYQSWSFDQRTAAATPVTTAFLEPAVSLHDGDVVGRLEVPRIGLSVMVFQGVGAKILIVGAGHVPDSPLPGAEGNVSIAAHRDTFFRTLKGILHGDSIRLTTARRAYEYVVDSTEIVGPEDVRVMESHGHPELTLITCYPFYFIGAAPQRFVVHALPAQ